MAVFVEDNFIGSSGTLLTSHTAPVGGAWTITPGVTGTSTLELNGSNGIIQAVQDGAADNAYFCNAGAAASANYIVQAKFTWGSSFPGTAFANIGLSARIQASGYKGYVLSFSNFTTVQLVLYNGSGSGGVLNTAGISNVQSSSIIVELRVTGTTISGYINGTQVITATDNTITTAGMAGLNCYAMDTSPSSIISNFIVSDGAAFSLTGPTAVANSATTTNFTVTPIGGSYSGTITLSDGGHSGTFTPSTLTFSGTAAQTFTYTPAVSNQTVSITGSASPALTAPPAWSLNVGSASATTYTLTGPSSGQQFAASTNFTVQVVGTLASSVVVTPSDGSQGGTFTPSTVTLASGSNTSATFTYTPIHTGTITVSTSNNGALTDPGPLSYSVAAVITADNSNFKYVGKGAIVGTGSSSLWKTINSGGQIYAKLLNTATCTLLFNVANCSTGQYPDIIYQIDGGGYNRVTLTSTGQVACTFPTFSSVLMSTYPDHVLEVWVEGAFDAGSSSVNVWNSLIGAVQFQGLLLDSGATLSSQVLTTKTIEFCGDSVVDTVRELGSGSYSQTLKAAHIGWPAMTAKSLGALPVMNGFPGDGLVNTSGGPSGHTLTFSYVPLGGLADPLCFAGQSYTPAVQPVITVVEYGTNDAGNGTTGSQFQAAYLPFLQQKRAQYPRSTIVAYILPSMSSLASFALAAFTSFNDSNSVFVNKSTATYPTTDGTHLSYTGAVQAAVDLAAAISAFTPPVAGASLYTQYRLGL